MPGRPPPRVQNRDIVPNRTRMDLKVPPLVREFIVDGAQAALESISAFIITAAVERAHKLLRDPARFAAVVDEIRRSVPYARL